MNVAPKDLKEVKSEKAVAANEKIDETKKADNQMDLEIEEVKKSDQPDTKEKILDSKATAGMKGQIDDL